MRLRATFVACALLGLAAVLACDNAFDGKCVDKAQDCSFGARFGSAPKISFRVLKYSPCSPQMRGGELLTVVTSDAEARAALACEIPDANGLPVGDGGPSKPTAPVAQIVEDDGRPFDFTKGRVIVVTFDMSSTKFDEAVVEQDGALVVSLSNLGCPGGTPRTVMPVTLGLVVPKGGEVARESSCSNCSTCGPAAP